MAKKKTPKAETPHFAVSVTVSGKTYIGEGASLTDAYKAVPQPTKIMGKGVISLTSPTKTVTKTLWPAQLKRMLYPAFRDIHVKRLAFLLQ